MRFFAHRPTLDPSEVQVYACPPTEADDLLALLPGAEPIPRRTALAIFRGRDRFAALFDDGMDRPPQGFKSAIRNCLRSTARLLS